MNAPLKNHFLADNMVLKNASWKIMVITAKILSFLGGTKMKQHNRKKVWKAIVAIVLVMVSLFSISTAVSAGFVEKVFEEVCDMINYSSSNTHVHTQNCYTDVTVTVKCTILQYFGDYPICTAGVARCYGGRHNVKETWQQLTCGNP